MKKNLKNKIVFLLNTQKLSNLIHTQPETKGHIYIKSLFNISQTINRSKAEEFLYELKPLIIRSNIPYFNYQIIQLIYERWLIYPEIINSLIYFSKKIKTKKLDVEVWERIIYKCKYGKEGYKSLNGKLFLIPTCVNLNFSAELDINFIDQLMEINLPSELLNLGKINFEKELLIKYEILFYLSKHIQDDEYLEETKKNEVLNRTVAKFFAQPNRFTNYEEGYISFIKLLCGIMSPDFIVNYDEKLLLKVYEIYQLKPELFSDQWIDPKLPKNDDILSTIFQKFIVSAYFRKNLFHLNEKEKEWFREFLKGTTIKNLKNLPFKPTNKAIHIFRNTEDHHDLNVTDGLIVSQLIAEGTTIDFALAFLQNLRNYNTVNFWLKIIPSFSKKKLIVRKLGEVMDYISHKTFNENIKVDWKRKKMTNLILESHKWHNEIRLKRSLNFVGNTELPVSKIEPFKITLSDNSKFQIKQLTTFKELYIEGFKLQHCVYSYKYDCLYKRCVIYSLRHLVGKSFEPLITIEVRGNKVFQMRGYHNRVAKNNELEVIFEWMIQNNFQPSYSYYNDQFLDYLKKEQVA
jgi:hypothetical protein